MPVINTIALNNQERGLAVSFAREAKQHAAATQYRDAHLVRSYMGSSPETKALRRERVEIAQPHTIGFHTALPDGDDITGSAVTIKEPGSLVLGVPECFDFTLPIAQAAGSDVLKLYGSKRFRSSELLLIVQRTDMEPGEVHRPDFGGWHDHMWSPSGQIDLIYCFSSTLPTEFEIGGKPVPALQNALTRFGAEYRHRSPENTGEETLRRTWGAVIVTNGKHTPSRYDNGKPCNIATDESHLVEFRRAANRYLQQPAVSFAPALDPLAAVA